MIDSLDAYLKMLDFFKKNGREFLERRLILEKILVVLNSEVRTELALGRLASDEQINKVAASSALQQEDVRRALSKFITWRATFLSEVAEANQQEAPSTVVIDGKDYIRLKQS